MWCARDGVFDVCVLAALRTAKAGGPVSANSLTLVAVTSARAPRSSSVAALALDPNPGVVLTDAEQW